MPPGGSMGPRYVLKRYLVKNHKFANQLATTKARGKNTYLEALIKLATYF
jgi:hypothetical protein